MLFSAFQISKYFNFLLHWISLIIIEYLIMQFLLLSNSLAIVIIPRSNFPIIRIPNPNIPDPRFPNFLVP